MTAQDLIEVLVASGVDFATGVPDSLLAGFSSAIGHHASIRHVIAANEGSAVALAAGNYLATGRRALVYMQNSGLPNAINPHISMCHPDAYGIPSIWLIGWRGQPGTTDEPQHMTMGAKTSGMLQLLGVPVFYQGHSQSSDAEELQVFLKQHKSETVAILISAGALTGTPVAPLSPPIQPLLRGDVLEVLIQGADPRDVIFAGIGHVGRELLAARTDDTEAKEFVRDFLCVGGMGHANQFALGFALSQPERRVWCLDGDGAFTMHMGSCNWISRVPNLRFVHVLFDNGVHASVGGQAVCGDTVDYGAIALAIGYSNVYRAESLLEAKAVLSIACQSESPTFLWFKVDPKTPPSLPRPRMSLAHRGAAFLKGLHD